MQVRNSTTIHPGHLSQPLATALTRASEDRAIQKLNLKDVSLFGKTGSALENIENRLGWMDSITEMKSKLTEIETFANTVLDDGYAHIVLLGMGGSSLAPEVFKRTFGMKAGVKSFDILDTTDPQEILTVVEKIELSQTLFIVASKSGKTIETLSLAKYFWNLMENSQVDNPGQHFVAITDPGSSLVEMGKRKMFRNVFLNQPDIGGRYSALSYFGLVPAAFTGANLKGILKYAEEEQLNCNDNSYDTNEAFRMGVLWAVGAERGVDKLTFLATQSLRPFVPWVEQLIAESTGKEGKGVIPIEGEPIAASNEYGSDRMFVFLVIESDISDDNDSLEILRKELIAKGAPVIDITFPGSEWIGAGFYQMEYATAVAGYQLGINPFDEPNVQESKDNTAEILQHYEESGVFPILETVECWESLEVTELGAPGTFPPEVLESPQRTLKRFFSSVGEESYISILLYLPRSKELENAVSDLRASLRNKFGVATTRGYGPRFLHSVGQLYKGGPPSGIFIVFAGTDSERIPIPEVGYNFGQLKSAQTIGDTQALAKRGLPTMMINLSSDPIGGIDQFRVLIEKTFRDKKPQSKKTSLRKAVATK
ncbi:MAG: glucose-6-phosphate isomerase [candidate division Zixibacteria bacterium]|nr:glucose-6-phosphate isomerase [candidate division Zixibacteria bacterium]